MFRLEPTQWKDSDRDGFGDELDGFEGDQCPDVAGTSRLDRFGCPDSDGDGWSDPDENWTIGDGADAYIKDPLKHIYVEPIVVENKQEEKNFFTSPVMLAVYCIAVLVLAGLAFVMTRGPKQPEMKQYNQMGMQQAAMQQQVTMPAAQAKIHISNLFKLRRMHKLLLHQLFNPILLWITTMGFFHKDILLNKPQCLPSNTSLNSIIEEQ